MNEGVSKMSHSYKTLKQQQRDKNVTKYTWRISGTKTHNEDGFLHVVVDRRKSLFSYADKTMWASVAEFVDYVHNDAYKLCHQQVSKVKIDSLDVLGDNDKEELLSLLSWRIQLLEE